MGYLTNHPQGQEWPFTTAQREVIGLLPDFVQSQVRNRGAMAVLKEVGQKYYLPGMALDAAILGLVAVHRPPETVEQATVVLDAAREAEEAKRAEREDENFRKSEQDLMRDGGYSDPEGDKHADESEDEQDEGEQLHPGSREAMEAMQERLKERAVEQNTEPRVAPRWHFTPVQEQVLEMFSEEDRRYALEHGAAALAREALSHEARRGRYDTGDKSTSRLLHDALAGRRPGPEKVRAAHLALFGTASEHSTVEGEAELERMRTVLAMLPPLTQQEIHETGTALEEARCALGPYAFAELDTDSLEPAAAERAALAGLVRKYVRDDQDRERALVLLGQPESVPPSSAKDSGWERDSLEFGGNGRPVQPPPSAEEIWEKFGTKPEPEDARAEAIAVSKAQSGQTAVTPTPDQAKVLKGVRVVADEYPSTPPRGPVVKSAFHDIVEKVEAVAPHDRANLFAELADYVPTSAVAQFLERGGPAVKFALADLSAQAREDLARAALSNLDHPSRHRVLDDTAGGMTDGERGVLAESLLLSLPMHARGEVINALGVMLPQSVREALGLRSALFQAGISLTFPATVQDDEEDQD